MSRLARARKKLRLLLSRWRPEVVRGQVDATNQFKTEVVSEAKKLVSKAPK